jgi:hypothetical protein
MFYGDILEFFVKFIEENQRKLFEIEFFHKITNGNLFY